MLMGSLGSLGMTLNCRLRTHWSLFPPDAGDWYSRDGTDLLAASFALAPGSKGGHGGAGLD